MYLSEMFIEEVLNEQSKLKALIAAGKLGSKAVARAGKAGLFKSRREYFKAFDKGTENIMQKNNIKKTSFSKDGNKIENIEDSHSTFHGKYSPQIIHMPEVNRMTSKQREEYFHTKRHEVDEERKKAIRMKGKTKIDLLANLGYRTKDGHISDIILKNEREYTHTANVLYGKRNSRINTEKYRKHSGEYDDVNHRTRKEINNLEKYIIKRRVPEITKDIESDNKLLRYRQIRDYKKNQRLQNELKNNSDRNETAENLIRSYRQGTK